MKAIVVDKDYGSAKPEEIEKIRKIYTSQGIEFEACHFISEDEIIQGCKEADAILCTGNPPITRKVMEALPKLKYVQRFGIGVNSIDLEAASELNKIILNIPGFCAKELADLSSSFILGLIRNTVYYDREIRKGNWPKCQYLLPLDLRELTLGLYGFGSAGQHLYQTIHDGWKTKIIACDPYLPENIKEQYSDIEFVDFDTLVKESDIISIHVGLTKETRHIFNRDVFRQMKNNALIINTARGPIINQEDLAWALENGEIRGAGLDTVEKEPIDPKDPLLKMDNVILSDHCGSYGVGAKKTQIDTVCRLIPQAVYEKKLPARNVANKSVMKKSFGIKFF